MRNGNTPKVNIRIIQMPKYVQFKCPLCGEDTQDLYHDYAAVIGLPCDWIYTEIKCPECDEKIEIDTIKWD